jgi:hypothetical protein
MAYERSRFDPFARETTQVTSAAHEGKPRAKKGRNTQTNST